jgi:tetratricopeptide (TPR) repeat protein
MRAEAEYQKAIADYKAGNYGQARARLQGAVNSLAKNWHAHFLLGVCHFECHDLSLAEAWLKRSLALSPESEKALYYLGIVNRAKRNETAAVEFFARALAINPSFEEARAALARGPGHDSRSTSSNKDASASPGGGHAVSTRKGASVVIADVSDPVTQFPKDWKKYEKFARRKARIDHRAERHAFWTAVPLRSLFILVVYGCMALVSLALFQITGPLEIVLGSIHSIVQSLGSHR